MSLLTVLMVAIALGMDSFAISIGIGLSGLKLNKIIIFAVTVFVLHVTMPLVGLVVGEYLGSLIGDIATIIGSIVLIILGVSIAWSSINAMRKTTDLECVEDSKIITAFSSVWGIILLAFSVSVDALSVGFGLGTMADGSNILTIVLIIGLFACILTLLGYFIGKRLGCKFQDKAELLGGIILILVGIKIIIGG